MAEEATIGFINGRWTKNKSDLRVVEDSEIIHVHEFKGAVAKVERGYGLTINLGKFESARVDVFITVPCHVEDIENADTFAKKWCSDRIRQEVANIRGGGKNGNGNGKKPNF